MNKIRQYFTTFVLIRGLSIAVLSSGFIYLAYFHLDYPLLTTCMALFALYLLLDSDTATWFVSGVFIGLFWFGWIALSLIHYDMLWAAPIEILIIMLTYGFLFAFISWVSNFVSHYFVGEKTPQSTLISLGIKAIGLLLLSYVHPFSFDWFKPELMFVSSYLGISKFSFAMVLLGIVLSVWQKRVWYLALVLLAYPPAVSHTHKPLESITLITTHTSVKEKWDETLHPKQFQALFQTIDEAIAKKKTLIVLPESVFPVFINRSQTLIDTLQEKAKHISIVTGGLYWDGQTPRNATYIFSQGKITVANKVLLVPFGESNPLPDFLSDWVNKVFYDGAVDYKASDKVTDYQIDGITYRNAICFEATSEKLYKKGKNGKRPEHMIVLSNNGWFHPSIESSLQKLLLLYYNKKYGTTIYHSINMSESYVISDGTIIKN